MKTKIGFWAALITTRKAKKLNQQGIKALQAERIEALIRHAKTNSKFYREKYSNLPENPNIDLLPAVCKKELMARFDEWITDPSVKLEDLNEYIKSTNNIGRPYRGKYLVSTTSGSTGIPAVFLYDKNSLNVLDALAVSRSIAYKGTMMKLIKAGGKSAAVYATGGHYLGVASVRFKQYKNPLKAKQFAVFSVLSPLKEIVNSLNEFQPALLGGYPTALELLVPEKIAGRLNIHPVLINTGGEYLSQELAKELTEVFGCPVQSGYSCTEGGLMAFQCSQGHLHINDDWVIIEPVDAKGRPVPPGTLSDKIYITNLANYLQPVIRYEVTDRVRVLESPCSCGSSLTAIEVEGRTDDILVFENGAVRIPPLAVYVILKEIHNVIRFQVIQKSETEVELRLETAGDRITATNEAIRKLLGFFMEKGATPKITLSAQLPSPSDRGKFSHVMKAGPS